MDFPIPGLFQLITIELRHPAVPIRFEIGSKRVWLGHIYHGYSFRGRIGLWGRGHAAGNQLESKH